MAANKFELSLLQAVSDWQRSATEKRAEALKEQCASLPAKFRTSVKRCYRQVGLKKGFVWDLIADDCLREKVSSWTLSYPVAMNFKNGVPPQGSDYHGVIVAIERPATTLVLFIKILIMGHKVFKTPVKPACLLCFGFPQVLQNPITVRTRNAFIDERASRTIPISHTRVVVAPKVPFFACPPGGNNWMPVDILYPSHRRPTAKMRSFIEALVSVFGI